MILLPGSKSATFLVIFIVAIIAFCIACVCASMTGQISILPNDNESDSFLDNLFVITNDTGSSGQSYGSKDYSLSSSSSSSNDDSQVETTTYHSGDNQGDSQKDSDDHDHENSNQNNKDTKTDSGHAGQDSGDANFD